jgi:3-hydroxymyristoyl/3-hydroxydecanoyl-(acyl carrier protein) dehydratase
VAPPAPPPPRPARARFAELAHDGETARAVVDPAHARALCAGHFPDDPLLPGAYLVELMAEVGGLLFGEQAVAPPPVELVRCTFAARITPDDRIAIVARRTAGGEDGFLEAEVHVRGVRAAHAVLRFATPR